MFLVLAQGWKEGGIVLWSPEVSLCCIGSTQKSKWGQGSLMGPSLVESVSKAGRRNQKPGVLEGKGLLLYLMWRDNGVCTLHAC